LRQTTVVNQYITQPVIERIMQTVAAPSGGYVTQAELANQFSTLSNAFSETIYGTRYSTPATSYASGGVLNTISLMGKIDNLSGTKLSGITVSGVSGLTDADIPDGITASNYLPLIGGTLSGNVVLAGNLTVTGAQTLSGALAVPYLNATSSTASSFVQASSTRFSIFDTAYFGGTSTTTINGTGSITLPAAALLTAPYASSTALSVSGTASTSALVASNSFTFLRATGFLKAVAGAVSTALINLASDVTGVLPIANGGTGWANVASGAIPYGNGSSALATTTAGTAGYVLAYLNGVPTWTATTTTQLSALDALYVGRGATTTIRGDGVASVLPYASTTVFSVSGSAYFPGGSIWNASGNVGIGTTTPNQLLNVVGNGATISVNDNVTGAGRGGELLLQSTNTNASEVTLASLKGYKNSGALGAEAGYLIFNTMRSGSLTEAMRILDSGNVGIGTVSPSQALEVAGGVGGTTGFVGLSILNNVSGTGLASSSIDFKRSPAHTFGQITAEQESAGTFANASLQFYTRAADLVNERMRITSAGKVGIGTTTPLNPLTAYSSNEFSTFLSGGVVSGNYRYTGLAIGQNTAAGYAANIGYMTHQSDTSLSGTYITNYGDSEGTTGIFVKKGGNVGIGTTTPNSLLTVSGNSPVLRVADTAASGVGKLSITDALGNEYMLQRDGTTGFLFTSGTQTGYSGYRWRVNGTTDAVTINNSGNVGIGTTIPTDPLVVTGTSGAYTGSGNESIFQVTTGTGASTDDKLQIGIVDGSYTWLQAIDPGNVTRNLVLNGAGGNVGMGTTTPWKKLSVTGTVGFDGLTAGAGAGSLCLTANKEVVYSNNAGCTGSSLRFKHDIVSLDTASGIEEAMKLNPVSFVYNDDIGIKGPQVGFIAEDVAGVDTRLVTYDAGGIPNNVKYANMVAIAIKAIQDMWVPIVELKKTIAGFADNFFSNKITARNELCIGATCIGESDLKALVALKDGSVAAVSAPTTPAAGQNSTNGSAGTAVAEPPVITINGENPARLNVGDRYSDLGATITAPESDKNLGLKLFLNGTLTSNIVLDTSKVATDTIDYVAVDSAGLTATSTRTVVIEAAASAIMSSTPVTTTLPVQPTSTSTATTTNLH
jgi:hypothetical protein